MISRSPSRSTGGWRFGTNPAARSVSRSAPTSAASTPTSRSTSRVARACFHAETASPPITAIRRPSGSRTLQSRSRTVRISSATFVLAGPGEPFRHPEKHPVVLLHLLFVPAAVGRAQVAVRADLPPQAGEEELLRGIHHL